MPAWLALALEPRFMFDAAGVATASDHADQPAAHDTPADADAAARETQAQQHQAAALDSAMADIVPAATTATPTDAVPPAASSAGTELRAADPTLNNGRKEAVLIDSAVADWQVLADAVRPGVEVVLIDGSTDGLSQMAAWAAGKSGYDAVTILSHGEEGTLHLGTAVLTGASLTARSAELAAVGGALTAGGDLLLYGCDIAGGAAGATFIGDLAALTGADIAASTDRTGAAGLGGDWVLESSVGSAEATSPFVLAGAELYGHVLDTAPVLTSDDTATVTIFDGTGAAVKTLTATDADGDQVAYSIVSVNGESSGGAYGLFTIDGNSGAITVTGNPATLTPGSYALVVRATDNGSPTQFDQRTLTVSVTATLKVTTAAIDATAVSGTYATDAGDGTTAGLDLNEALYYADTAIIGGATAVTISFDAGLDGGMITVGGTGYRVADNVTFNVVDSSLTISGQGLEIGSGVVFSVESGRTLTVASTLTGTAGLSKAGSGSLTLTGANTYSGTTAVDAGVLTLGTGGSIDDGSAVTVADGSTLTLTHDETVGSIAGAGTIGLGANTLTVGGSDGSTEFSGSFTASSGGVLEKTGSGTLTLSGANDSTPLASRITAGTLAIASKFNLGSGALSVAAGATLSVSQSTTLAQTIAVPGGSADSAHIQVLNDSRVEVTGQVTGGSGILEKTGNGVLEFANADNTYAGTVKVVEGALAVTGSLAAGVTVTGDGRLEGTGRVGGDVTVDQHGTVAPGVSWVNNGIGTLTIGGFLNLNGILDGTLAGTVAGVSYDQVVAEGGIRVGATAETRIGYQVSGSSNTVFLVAVNGSANPTDTTSAPLGEGGSFISEGQWFTISFVGGTGNDIVLRDNAPPAFTSTAVTAVNEDSPYRYAVATSDAEGDAVTVTATTLPSWLAFAGGLLTGTPPQANIGANTIVLRAVDSKGAVTTQSFTVTVAAVNDPPQFQSSPPVTVQPNGSYRYQPVSWDEEGETVTLTAATLPAWLSFSGGVLSGTPQQTDGGTHTVVLRATDASGASTTQSFTIAVAAPVAAENSPPVFTSTPPGTVAEHGSYSYTPAATDPEGQALTFAATTLPSWLSFSGGVLSGTPQQAVVGTHTVVLTATDPGGASTIQSFTIIVAEVNDPPGFTSTPPVTGTAGAAYSYTPTATDPEGQALTFATGSLPSWLSFRNGLLSGTPQQSDAGTYTVVLTATDPGGAGTTQSFTVTVTAPAPTPETTNQAPGFTSATPTPAAADQLYSFTVTTTDPDSGDSRRITGASLPAWLRLVDEGDGTATLSGTPTGTDAGSTVLTLTVTDSAGASATQTVTLTVTGAPVTTIASLDTTTTTGGQTTASAAPVVVVTGTTDLGSSSSAADALHRKQGLTSSLTTEDAGATSDLSTFVRNAVRNDPRPTSAFYGAAPLVSEKILAPGSDGGPGDRLDAAVRSAATGRPGSGGAEPGGPDVTGARRVVPATRETPPLTGRTLPADGAPTGDGSSGGAAVLPGNGPGPDAIPAPPALETPAPDRLHARHPVAFTNRLAELAAAFRLQAARLDAALGTLHRAG